MGWKLLDCVCRRRVLENNFSVTAMGNVQLILSELFLLQIFFKEVFLKFSS